VLRVEGGRVRSPGEYFSNHLRTRVPWVIAILALVTAASTGTLWATSRIRSLDTDLTAAGNQSRLFRDQMRSLTDAKFALQTEVEELEADLTEARNSISELKKGNWDLRHCVSKANPEGGPIVTLFPGHGPPGTLVQMTGSCFIGKYWQNETKLMDRRGISLLGAIDSQGRVAHSNRRAACELIARGSGELRVNRAGRMRGHFIVPRGGVCFKKGETSSVVPGSYSLIIGCRTCAVGDFRVTTEEGERRRLQPCSRGDYRWFLEGPDGSRAMVVFGVRVELVRGAPCRFSGSMTLTLTGPATTALPIGGLPAAARFEAALGRQQAAAAWGWQNWCGTPGPYVLSAALGSETKTKSFAISPRCNSRKYGSQLIPLGALMEGVASQSS
jgi:hypothetical protein